VTVVEDPSGLNYTTAYAYSAIDNLATVTQGSQTRSFVYDSLSRLTSATNPESGTITYLTRTDGRGFVTTNGPYDGLNRVPWRTYSDGTPTVNFTYDDPNVTFSRGRLTQVTSSASTRRIIGYDALGRILQDRQTTDSVNYDFAYVPNADGTLASQEYPSDRTVNYTYDAAGRITSANGSFNGNPAAYIITASYAAHGAASQLTLGNGLVETTQFNSRLQPTQIQGRLAAHPWLQLRHEQ
jgi:YD repeat-containing protein